MNEKASSCPFCGCNEVEFIWFMAVNDVPFEGYIECKGCETSGPTTQATDDESNDCEARAIKAWNIRRSPDGFLTMPIAPTEKIMAAMVTNSGEDLEDVAERYEAIIAAAWEFCE